MDQCFKEEPLGEKKIRSLVKNACVSNGIKGVGTKEFISFHGLRETVDALLVESGMPESSTFLRASHGQVDRIHPYHNIQGKKGHL